MAATRVVLMTSAEDTETEAVLVDDVWRCPHDGGALGDRSGVRAVRLGMRCPVCGAVAVEVVAEPKG